MQEQTPPGRRRPRRGEWFVMTDTTLVEGLSPELLAALALRRALGGGVARAGNDYVDYGHPIGRYLISTFTELIDCGLLALADDETGGLRRVTVTDAGQARYAQVCGVLRRNRR